MGNRETDQFSVLFKRLNITAPTQLDVLLEKLGVRKPYSIDVLLQRYAYPIYDLGVLLEKENISLPYAIDVILKAITITIGGGHPIEIEYPEVRVEYIDHFYVFNVYELDLKASEDSCLEMIVDPLVVSSLYQEIIETEELSCFTEANFDIEFASLQITIPKGDKFSTIRLSVPIERSYSFSIGLLALPIRTDFEFESYPSLFTGWIAHHLYPASFLINNPEEFNSSPLNIAIEQSNPFSMEPLKTVIEESYAFPAARLVTLSRPLSRRLAALETLTILDETDDN